MAAKRSMVFSSFHSCLTAYKHAHAHTDKIPLYVHSQWNEYIWMMESSGDERVQLSYAEEEDDRRKKNEHECRDGNGANNCIGIKLVHISSIHAKRNETKRESKTHTRKGMNKLEYQTKSHYKNEWINSQSDHDFIPFVFYHDFVFVPIRINCSECVQSFLKRNKCIPEPNKQTKELFVGESNVQIHRCHISLIRFCSFYWVFSISNAYV